MNDELSIFEPNSFNGHTGTLIITWREAIVCPEGLAGLDPFGDLSWDYEQLQLYIPSNLTPHYLGVYRGQQVFTVELNPDSLNPISCRLSPLRHLLGQLPEGLFRLLGRALQINDWHQGHRHCGYCGEPTSPVKNERAMGCGSCKKIYYPRLSPCIMALIVKGEECLLARNGEWTVPIYSVLAGFIEPGESVESALRREVKEEVNLNVGQLDYIDSQPWPFPGQLMLGFFAQYQSGDIAVDGVEIAEANWYHYTDLPKIPGKFSLSGQLIRTFVQRFH